MSRKLLQVLNGNNTGKLAEYLKTLDRDPRIAWYPSSGEDFRDLLFLHKSYNEEDISGKVPEPPEFFIHTDYFPWSTSTFLDTPIIHDDQRTKITVTALEELPGLNLPLDKEIVAFDGSHATGKVLYLELLVESNRFGTFTARLIYAFVENEAFCAKVVLPNAGRFSHIVRVVYGSGFGGGYATGIWLNNVLPRVGCEVFITDDRQYIWSHGDVAAVVLYPELGPQNPESENEFDPDKVIYSTRNWHERTIVRWIATGLNSSSPLEKYEPPEALRGLRPRWVPTHRDFTRIEKVIWLIRDYWREHPEYRFFQLLEVLKQQILRIKTPDDRLADATVDLFYLEDDELLKILQKINAAPDKDASE